MADQNALSRLPKIDQVLAQAALAEALDQLPRALVLRAARQSVDQLRRDIIHGAAPPEAELSAQAVAARAADLARQMARPSLRGLINATGVVVHTNLGRSVLAEQAIARIVATNGSYSNLEYNLEGGRRGSRYEHVAGVLREITGAEAALVVNNNAAAVFLALQSLAAGREVIVSRGQLVEIGGSFRIPDVMARSGAILREVGATNKTHIHDYERAISDQTALLLKVHTSNFAVVGFHQEVALPELVALGRKRGLPVMDDLGSGCFVDLAAFGLPREPTVQDALAMGADLVAFSGDKLLGGPQAGILLGRADLIGLLRQNPINRALRIDKLTLAALEATLELYRDPQKALTQIPTLRMLSTPYDELAARAAALLRKLRALKLPRLAVRGLRGTSLVGGGALPLAAPDSRLLEVAIEGRSATALEAALRAWRKPIICRLDDGHLLMDMRTILPADWAEIIAACKALAA